MGTVSEQQGFNLSFLRCAAGTDVGMRRDENQDSFGVFKGQFYVGYFIADGMGGVHGGATASRLAISTVEELLERSPSGVTADTLVQIASEANSRIFERGSQDASLAGMGTTLVGLVFTPDGTISVNVGDSRAYRIRGNSIQQLTEDHTLVRELVRSGAIPVEEAERHPVSHMLTRSLGPVADVQVEARVLPEQPELGDIFILCSDGLYNLVSDEEMLGVVRQNPLDDANQILINLANQRGGPDNITVLVISVGERVGRGRTQEYRKARDFAAAFPQEPAHADLPASDQGQQPESPPAVAEQAEQEVAPPPVQEPKDRRQERQRLLSQIVQSAPQQRGVPVPLLVIAALVLGMTAGDIARRVGVDLGSFSFIQGLTGSDLPPRVTSLSDLTAGLELSNNPSQGDLRLPEIARQVDVKGAVSPPSVREVDGANASRDVLRRAITGIEQQIALLSSAPSPANAEALASAKARLAKANSEFETLEVEVEAAEHAVTRWSGRRAQLDDPNADIFKLANQLKAAGACPERPRQRLDRISDLSNKYQEIEGGLEVDPYDEKLKAELSRRGDELRRARNEMQIELRGLFDSVVFKADSEYGNLRIRRDSLFSLRSTLQNEIEILEAISDPTPGKRAELRARLDRQLEDMRATLAAVERR